MHSGCTQHSAVCGSRSADRSGSRYIDVINFNFQTPNVRDPTIERCNRGARARARRRRDIAICVGFRRDPLRSCLRSRFSVPRSAGGRRRWTMRRRRVACIKLAEFQILRIANRRSGGASRRFMLTPPIRAPRPAHYRRQYKASQSHLTFRRN